MSEITQAVIFLILIAGAFALLKDYVLATATILVLGVYLLQIQTVTTAFQKYSLNIGLFFLMIFLLFPMTNEKLNLVELSKQLFTPIGAFSLLAGFIVSYIGGKGLGVLPTQPVIMFAVIIGTLVAVLFFKGLPAGLIIAAGVVAVCKYFVSS
ncbi:MAG TPA: DUF441 family protein [Bacillota bacterium]|nr:DUF441 family protein [Bacillota bacterium]